LARHYSTGEVARKLNVSVRTLRYYDQINLVTPSYTNDVQKRFYSDDEMFRLHKIMLLKSMTVPLDEIRRILDEESLTSILSAHLSSLEEKIEGLKQAQNHTVTLLQSMKLENEKIDWTKLQTIQAKSNDREQWTDYFTEEESDSLQASLPKLEDGEHDTKKWINLIRRTEILIERGVAPSSKEAQILKEDLTWLTDETFGDNQQLIESFWKIRKSTDASNELGLYPIDASILAYIDSLYQEIAD